MHKLSDKIFKYFKNHTNIRRNISKYLYNLEEQNNFSKCDAKAEMKTNRFGNKNKTLRWQKHEGRPRG